MASAITVAIEDGARPCGPRATSPWPSTTEDPLLPQARTIAARHGTLSARLL